MVYKGDRILLYRNGELYTSHRTKNIALFSQGQDLKIDKITAWKMKSCF